MKKLKGLLLVSLGLALPYLSYAALGLTGSDCQSIGQGGIACQANDPRQLIIGVISLILGIAGLVAVLFIIIGGFQYITSAGNEELAGKGKKNLQNAVIGIIIIVLSYVIVNVISNLLIHV